MATSEIYNYRKVDDRLITAGQPRTEHFRDAASEGFEAVINLAPYDKRYSIDDEPGLVASLGMAYVHIPIDWENPTEADFAAFERAMHAHERDKTLVHCAANFRVTAFYSLYALQHLAWTAAQAEEFRASIWRGSNFPIWDRFVAAQTQRIATTKR
jgi:protein tyrosine phosphatase (PTP) superfamily phosphohydrolase (DUF442 family)